MREIKFRIWQANQKEYLYPDTGYQGLLIDTSGQIHEDMGFGEFVQFDRGYTIQQYTGLKDKNGVEIYEGDLLTYADNTTPEQIFEVKFLDERGTFVFRELYNPTFEGSDLPGWDDTILGQNAWDGWEIADAAKVIGNIFEGVDK